jgi:uncharacterized protein YciI
MRGEDLMFVILVNYVRPLEEIDKHLTAHVEFLKASYKNGELVASGRRTPRDGGIILSKHKSKDEAIAFSERDPFFINKVAEYKIFEWTPTMKIESMEDFVSSFV